MHWVPARCQALCWALEPWRGQSLLPAQMELRDQEEAADTVSVFLWPGTELRVYLTDFI